jgi:SWI/SNF-related matrix-associated actin-dependent regulator of chromatin subfamily B member 1
MNPSQSNGINPALLAAFQNSQQQPQPPPQQQQQSFSLPQQYGHLPQQSPQSAQYPQSQLANKFSYNNGVQYPSMYQGGGNQPVNQAQTMQSSPQGVNPAQLMNGARNVMPSINPPQMAAAASIYAKANMLAGGANGVSPTALMGGNQNAQASNMFQPSQMAQLANMGPQDRQKAMLFLQQQHQQRMLQHQHTQPVGHPQQQHQQQQQQQQQQHQQHQQQQQQQQHQQFDRPLSAMSGQQQAMMLPPPSAPPRPPTAMSRPGTSHSHNSSQPRPPSQASNTQPHPGQQQTFSMPGTPNLAMQQQYDGMETPGSPYRGSKRKLSAAGIPPMQTPRMGSQGLPIGLQNMAAGMENQPPMGGPQQQFPGNISAQHQYNVGARGGGPGVMGGAGGGMMGPPVVPRPNQQPPQAHQQSLQNITQHQNFDGAMDRNFGGEPSPTNMNPFMNGLHQAQMGGANGMTPGPSASPSASSGLTPAMLAQLQQHQQQAQPGFGTNSSVRPTSSGPGAITSLNQNFGQQMMTDPSRMNPLPANAMANLISPGAGTTNTANNKMTPGLGVGSQRPLLLGPPNTLPFHPNTSAAPPPVPPVPRPGPAPSSAIGHRPVPPSVPNAAALNPKVTQVSAVSLAASVKEIPPLTNDEIEDIKEWMRVDREYEDRYKAMEERTGEEVNSIVRKGEWWERDETAATARNRRDKFAIGLSNARIARRRGVGSRTGIKL